ncbi:MAG: SRPBCC family protein [Gammaproteobacteria bacterium]|nr:SRPBCC family protein [Gammaproteobacteria bacterium]
MTFNPQLDLRLEREIPVSASQVWAAWTKPELLMQWFCPKPWQVVACELDVQPGGRFATTMQSPDGVAMPESVGCYLAVDAERSLVWTNALLPGFAPAPKNDEPGGFFFTGEIQLRPLTATSTQYIATVRHSNEADCNAHREMGFEAGWGMALAQLVELMQEA